MNGMLLGVQYVFMNPNAMLSNSCLLYDNVNEVYNKLITFCRTNGFKIIESAKKYHFISARKRSLLFRIPLRLELEISAYEKEQVEVKALIYRWGKRKTGLEHKYLTAIENFLVAA